MLEDSEVLPDIEHLRETNGLAERKAEFLLRPLNGLL